MRITGLKKKSVDDIKQEIRPWVVDTSNIHSWDTKYHNTLPLHWTTKALLGKVLLDIKEERAKSLLEMDELNDKFKFLIIDTTNQCYEADDHATTI